MNILCKCTQYTENLAILSPVLSHAQQEDDYFCWSDTIKNVLYYFHSPPNF